MSTFYSDLWSTTCNMSFSDVLHALPDDLLVLTDSDYSMLTQEIIKNEIHQLLFSLPSGKSPGPYGFNAEFYSFFWEDLGEHLFTVIKYFFISLFFLDLGAKPILLLFPKEVTPNFFNDFCPISLCNVYYKFISKLLANYLKKVL